MLVPDMAGPDGERVKLLDFGIAKLGSEHDPSPDRPTRTGQIFGTTAYMSPEQFMNGKPVDGQSDVYSFGALIYRLLAGRLPFVSDRGEMALAAMHMFELPQPLKELAPWVSPWLCELVDQMLLKDAAKRPTMAEVAARLGEHLPFRVPSRSSLPPPSSSANVPTVTHGSSGQATAADSDVPFVIHPQNQSLTELDDSGLGGLAKSGSDDSQPPSLNVNGQLTGSALGGFLRRPLLVAVSFSVLGAGIGGAFVLRALRPQTVAQTQLTPASTPPHPLPPAAAAVSHAATAATPAALPAAAKPTQPAGPSAGSQGAHHSHKPASRVRIKKRKDWKKDGTPPSAAAPHSTLLDD